MYEVLVDAQLGTWRLWCMDLDMTGYGVVYMHAKRKAKMKEKIA